MPSRVVVTGVAAALVLVAGAAARADSVTVGVKPATGAAGRAITITARPKPVGGACVPTITRPGAPATKLAAKKPAGGAATWRWTVPKSAKPGKGTARVVCAGAGSGSARFTIATGSPPPPPPFPPPAPPAPPAGTDPAAGKSVFLANCGSCHTLADAGTRGSIGPNLDIRRPTYPRVVDRVTNGRNVMPSFKDVLSEQEIRDVAAYVSSVAGT